MTATLGRPRRAIEVLARESGQYRLVCTRHGGEPVPATGLRFESRVAARIAACAVEQYREILREYDPELSVHDIVVAQGRHVHRESRSERFGSITTAQSHD
jgi:hypothetical protein